MRSPLARQVIFSADDFGMSEEVNEAVEIAHRTGVLSTASLMVAGPAAADAIRRARTMPDLRVGLHVVVIEGDSVLKLPAITDLQGGFGRQAVTLGFDYFFSPASRRALRQEIEAQFRAFGKTGLVLDHANAHKHMHLHPTVGRLIIASGLSHGLRAMRTPLEPLPPLQRPSRLPDTALRLWTRMLRRQIRRAGLKTNDWCFGLHWSGHMTPERVQRLIPRLPAGRSEIYFHPATGQNAMMRRVMADYDQPGELAALTDPLTRRAVEQAGIERIGWADL